MHLRKKQKRYEADTAQPSFSYEGDLPDVPVAAESVGDDDDNDEFFSDEYFDQIPTREGQLDSNISWTAGTTKYEECHIKSEIYHGKTVDQIATDEQKPRIENKGASACIGATDSNENDSKDELDKNEEGDGPDESESAGESSQHSSKIIDEIKQEQITGDDSRLERYHSFVNDRNCYYCCHVCDQKMTDHIKYFGHLASAHKLKYRLTESSNFELEPILEDPNHYCRTCEKSFSTRRNYRKHLQWIHHMMFRSPKVSLERALSSNQPGSTFYCGACDLAFESEIFYYKHINTTHRISSFGPRANPNLEPNVDNPYNYCRPCDKLFRNPNRYRGHLNDIHNVSLVRHPELLPDWHDENYYCPACELNLLSKNTFHDHCINVHNCGAHGKIAQGDEKDPPDPQDPSLRCGVCNMDFEKLGQYKQHCQLEHEREHSKPSPTDSDDPQEEDTHCMICNKRFKAKKYFYRHLERFHAATRAQPTKDPRYHCSACDKYFRTGASLQSHFRWIHSSMLQPSIYDPDHYCRTCKHIYNSQQAYHSHLQQTHNIDVAAQLANRTKPSTGHSTNSFLARQTIIVTTPPSSTQEFPIEVHAANTLRDVPYIGMTSVPNASDRSLEQSEPDAADTADPDTDQPIVFKRVTIDHGGSVVEYIIPENDGRPRPKVYTNPNLPDPNDPTFYCRICKKFKKSELKHRLHCKQVHKMELGPYYIPFPNPDAEIDLADPDCYCARCDKSCAPRSFFKQHLARIHGIISTIQQPTLPTKHDSSSSTTENETDEAAATAKSYPVETQTLPSAHDP